MSCIFSLTGVALCTKKWRLASNAEINQVLKQRRHDCLLLDAIERYHSAVQLTLPTASTQKSRIIVSEFSFANSGFPNNLLPTLSLAYEGSWV